VVVEAVLEIVVVIAAVVAVVIAAAVVVAVECCSWSRFPSVCGKSGIIDSTCRNYCVFGLLHLSGLSGVLCWRWCKVVLLGLLGY
jgi:hypothetical protein